MSRHFDAAPFLKIGSRTSAGVVDADTVQQQTPALVQQNQVQQQQQQQQRQVQQTYRRGVTPPPIARMTLPSIGPSNYTVAHMERTYWGTAERHPASQLFPQLPGMGQPSQPPAAINTSSVYRYLPASSMSETAVAGTGDGNQNAMRSSQSSASTSSASPFGPSLPPVNVRP